MDFRTKTEDSEEIDDKSDLINFEEKTPEEILENSYQTIRKDLAQDYWKK